MKSGHTYIYLGSLTAECRKLWAKDPLLQKKDRSSVTRWLYFLIKYLAIYTIKICPIAKQIWQNKFKIWLNTKWTLSKWSKCFNVVPKWRNFAKSGHTGPSYPFFSKTWINPCPSLFFSSLPFVWRRLNVCEWPFVHLHACEYPCCKHLFWLLLKKPFPTNVEHNTLSVSPYHT